MIPSRVNLINVLVPVKRAIDYAVKIRIAKDGKGVDTTVKHSMVSSLRLVYGANCSSYSFPICALHPRLIEPVR